MINGFTDDHLLRKSFNAYDTKEENDTKEKLEATIATTKSWMDKVRLKQNVDKTVYIAFGSRTHLKKVSKSPLTTCNDVI